MKLDFKTKKIGNGMYQISYSSRDKDFVTKLAIELFQLDIQFCEKCEKQFIVKSPTHKICWRCKN